MHSYMPLSSLVSLPFEKKVPDSPPLSFTAGKKQLAVTSFVINLLALALPLTTLQVYDRLLLNPNAGTLYVLSAGVVALLVLETLLRLARAYVINWAGAVYEHTLSCNALRHMLGAQADALATDKPGAHLQRMNRITRLREFASGQALVALIDLPFVVIFLVLIFWLAGALVLVPLVLLVVFGILAFRLGRRLKTTLHKRDEHDRARLNFIIEALEGIHTLKALALEPFFQRIYEQRQQDTDTAGYFIAKMNAASANYGALFSQIMVVGMIAFGAPLAMGGTLTMGTLIACVLLAGRIMRPVQQALGLWVRYQDFQLAREDVGRIFTLPKTQRVDPENLGERDGTLQLENVTFRDKAEGKALFENVTLALKHGDIVSLSGSRGSGKDILLRTVAGLYKPASGKVLIDGTEATQYPARELIKHVGYLPMEGVIFRGTIRENLSAFGEHDNTQVEEIVRLLNLDREIRKLPGGYETKLQGSQADPVPPGIRQRIVIARALAPKPRIILFGNADRGLDKEGYNRVYSLLARLKGKATMVIVSDDRNMVRLADRHYMLESGTLREEPKDADETLQSVSGYRELPL